MSFDCLRGKYIAFEGIDGCGKSIQLSMLQSYLRASSCGLPILHVREPGSVVGGKNDVADDIRKLLLHSDSPLSPMCEAMLFMAARAQLVHEFVAPSLNRGALCLSDRSWLSTVAYQSSLDSPAHIKEDDVLKVASIACGGVLPDLIIVFDVPVLVARMRILGASPDRMESRSDTYYEKVREAYRLRANCFDVVCLNGNAPPPIVFNDVLWTLKDRFGSFG